MKNKSDPWAIAAVLIALLAFIFGDNIYERMTSRELFEQPSVQSSPQSPTSVLQLPTSFLPTSSMTPDPCSPENIKSQIDKVHSFMKIFDDGSSLAASIPASQLSPQIANLQRTRRDAESYSVPPCLTTLKKYQILHMDTVIKTLTNLIEYTNGTVSKDVIDQGVALAREQHDNYTLELARLLGLTPVVATSTPSN